MLDALNRLVDVFSHYHIRYVFIGKGAAILYGYPGTTQDIDVFPQKDLQNSHNLVRALREIGFHLDAGLEGAILSGKDFIQIRGGPFPLDLVFAPDGIESFEQVNRRKIVLQDRFPCASLDDIIASKKAAGRQRDAIELPSLQAFKKAWDEREP